MIARLQEDIEQLCAQGRPRSSLVIHVHSYEDLRGIIVADGWPDPEERPMKLLGVRVVVDEDLWPGAAVVMRGEEVG